MSKGDKGIVKKTGLYFIGNFASKITMAAMIPFYAYFVTVEELGVFDYSQTIMYTVSPVIFVALWESILRFLLAETDIEKRQNVIATSIRTIQIIMFILLATIVATAIWSDNKIAMYTILMVCVYGIAQIWQYYARALKFNHIYVMASIWGTVLNFAISIVMICFLKMGGTGLFWSFIIGQSTIVIIIEFKLRILKYNRIGNFKWHILKHMLIFSIPLVLNLASNWIISGFGRIIITNKLGTYDNGLFSFAMKFGTVVSMLGTVISMALIEESIIKSKDEGIDKYFSKVIEIVFKLFLFICILAIPFIKLFYYFISGTEYFSTYNLVPFFLVYAIFMTMATNIGAIFQAKSKTNMLFYTTVIGAFVTISLALLMINKLGVLGVLFAQIVGALSMLVFRWLLAKKMIKLVVKWDKIIYLTAIYLIVVVICSKDFAFSIFIGLLASLFALYVNKDLIRDLKNFNNNKQVR
ncbi:hypothetical protein CEF21_21535 [Bacillus sp. FJAT-42376]|uniref:lipopolysaccharide biosynthesis protein n=1 Tax=Bacillus sp. FJAT-42376 TaxID=2014076 RepID=UPI000F4FA91E|nr:polysaccharide biosynthesis C-terminal domain-containing protein [Bacillus sp. FJAT-42376]AZB44663.1 hypothetical protein CEF21_21535 [Bacillus sp. FJAT-42376]